MSPSTTESAHLTSVEDQRQASNAFASTSAALPAVIPHSTSCYGAGADSQQQEQRRQEQEQKQ